MDVPALRPLLTAQGHLHVPRSAARQYAAGLLRTTGQKLTTGNARHDLIERLLVARIQSDQETNGRIRARSRSRAWGFDINVWCVVDGPQVIVVGVRVRRR